MVGRQLVYGTPRDEKPHRNIHDTRKRSYIHSLMQTETKYQEFNKTTRVKYN